MGQYVVSIFRTDPNGGRHRLWVGVGARRERLRVMPKYARCRSKHPRPNQAMQLTASKPAIYAGGVCLVSVCCVACTEGSRQLIFCLVRW